MLKCNTCAYSIFCPTWGEYKCTKKAITFTTSLIDKCSDYTAVKNKDEQPCQCEACLKRDSEE